MAPLIALFICFDFVIHNPYHPETDSTLPFLDVAAGYFSRLEFTSNGSLPSSILSEFTFIARQYIADVRQGNHHAGLLGYDLDRLQSRPCDSLGNNLRQLDLSEQVCLTRIQFVRRRCAADILLAYPTSRRH
jgi:hypothetical protein